MVKTIAFYAMGVVVAAGLVTALTTCKADPSKTGAQIAPLAAPRMPSATSDGEFRYTMVDGVPMIGWYAPDGKQVILMRVDARWVCDQSTGQLRCDAKQAATDACPTCLLGSCPCADARCLPLCVANSLVVPGLKEPATKAP